MDWFRYIPMNKISNEFLNELVIPRDSGYTMSFLTNIRIQILRFLKTIIQQYLNLQKEFEYLNEQ